jgi:hypothetical protein
MEFESFKPPTPATVGNAELSLCSSFTGVALLHANNSKKLTINKENLEVFMELN